MAALAPRQRDFVRAYCGLTGDLSLCGQGATAARAVGYSAAAAHQTAHAMLQLPHVQAAVEEVLAEIRKREGVHTRRAIDELIAMVTTNLFDVVDVVASSDGKGSTIRLRDEISPEAKAAISEIHVGPRGELKVKLHNRPAAIALLLKATGHLLDRPSVQVTVNGDGRGEGVTIEQMSRVRTVMGLPAIDATASEKAISARASTASSHESASANEAIDAESVGEHTKQHADRADRDAVARLRQAATGDLSRLDTKITGGNGHARHAPTTADDDEQG